MVYLMLHDDWEIYGDGTGDPEQLMFEPARRILDICDKHGAKYTFYAEVGQQINMLEAPSSKWNRFAQTWEVLIKEAVKRGHDVQLHFHPQWIGARLNNGHWQLDYAKWNTGNLDYELLDKWIGKGTDYLRSLLEPVNPGYKLLSYRAGGWMCQPSINLYKVLKKHGILCDVSVIKGRYKKFTDGGVIDFRTAFSSFEPWEVDPYDFANKQEGSGLWELPVYSELSSLPHPFYLLSKSFRPLYYYKIFKKRRLQKGGGDYTPQAVDSSNNDYYGSFGYMYYKHLLSFVSDIKNYSNKDLINKHLIFLTHSKSFLDYDNFNQFLCDLSKNSNITFINTRDFVKNALVNT